MRVTAHSRGNSRPLYAPVEVPCDDSGEIRNGRPIVPYVPADAGRAKRLFEALAMIYEAREEDGWTTSSRRLPNSKRTTA
jgi:hypothetical protein